MTTENTPLTQAEALHWLLVNRRPEVTFATALRSLRQAFPNDPQAQKSLDILAAEWRDNQKIFSRLQAQPTD